MTITRIVRIHAYGGPEVLTQETVERPSPGDDEILVNVRAIGINPIDWKLRQGYAKERIPLPLPVALGTDISGVVVSKGVNVAEFEPGDEVLAMLGLYGAYADYVVLKAGLAAPKPASITHLEAASIPLAGLTAWQGLFEQGEVISGQNILIHAGAGSVGGFAIQLAAGVGANVATTASLANHEFVSGLGASKVIDYHSQAFEQELTDVDMVLDLVGGDSTAKSLGILREGGILVQLVPSTEPVAELAVKLNVRAVYMTARSDGGQLRKLLSVVESGGVKTHVGKVFALSEISTAHKLSRLGKTRGKIVIDCTL